MIGEISGFDVKEMQTSAFENFQNMKPEREMTRKELVSAVKDEFDKASKEYKNDRVGGEAIDKSFSDEDHLTTSEQRKELARRSSGKWSGEPGDSTFTPEKPEARDALKDSKQIGIKYSDGEPDFSKVSEATVQIDKMTSSRPDNFRKADIECAKQWNEQNKDARSDWTARDVKDWRQENIYSWHERLDMKTMDLVQRDIHEECKHYGGVAECKRHEALNGGGFDE